MNQLVLHHTYIGGSAFDISGFANHGVPQDVTVGTGTSAGSFEFDRDTSGIVVPFSPSLARLTALRVRIKFALSPRSPDRYNLMEGFECFALYIRDDRALAATIVDRTGQWRGINSSPDLVGVDQWHEIEVSHDGISRLRMSLDGQIIAGADDVAGPVGSVGELGIAIGRWPDDARYVFEGHIGELQVWRFNPMPMIEDLLDRCCNAPRTALVSLIAKLRGAGVEWWHLAVRGRAAHEAVAVMVAAVREADPAAGDALDKVATEFMIASLRRNGPRVNALRRRARAIAERVLGPDALAELDGVEGLEALVGVDEAELRAAMRALCLDWLLPPRPVDPDQAPAWVRSTEPGPWQAAAEPPFQHPNAGDRTAHESTSGDAEG